MQQSGGERHDRHQWWMQGVERVAAVDKIEEKRKPEDFIGYRNRTVACRQLDGGNTLIFAFGKNANKSLSRRVLLYNPTDGSFMPWENKPLSLHLYDKKQMFKIEHLLF